ncbi:MAG: hypothetical protein WC734_01535 [Patescibacteria group bacterium]
MDTLTRVDITQAARPATIAFACLKRHNRVIGPGWLARTILRRRPLVLNNGFVVVITGKPGAIDQTQSATIGDFADAKMIPIWQNEAIAMLRGVQDHGKSGYRSSWECRSPEHGVWSGGIVTRHGLYIACRGIGHEHYDEVMALVVTALMGWEDLPYLRDIAHTSGNAHFEQIHLAAAKFTAAPASTR